MDVARRIEARIRAMRLTDSESAEVLKRFQEARLERRIRFAIQCGIVVIACVIFLLVVLFIRRWGQRAKEPLNKS